MKKRAKKAFNKNLKWILLIAIVVVIALGFLLMLISGNEDRDQVATEQNVASQQQREKQKAQKDDHPGVSDEALALYNARVDDMSDSSAVAQLLEATGMRSTMGKYMVTLNVKDDVKNLVIAFEDTVIEADQAVFDENAVMYAEQLLALIAEAGEVKWSYPAEKNGKTETVEGSLTSKQATKLLGMEIKDYAETPEMVQTLLHNQKGIR